MENVLIGKWILMVSINKWRHIKQNYATDAAVTSNMEALKSAGLRHLEE